MLARRERERRAASRSFGGSRKLQTPGELYKDWADLPPDMDSTSSPTGSPDSLLVDNTTLNDTKTATVEAGFYDEYSWKDMPTEVQDAWAVLGYDQLMWDSAGVAWSDEYGWDDFSPEHQAAASLLGYDKYSWDGIDPTTGEAIVYEDDWVSYDDDYLFQVGPAEAEIWVSQYQVLYFFAALGFLIVGVLDLIRERHVFHVTMILAGAFGVLSAIFIEENIHLSNVFNSISVHFYLLEGVTLFGEHKRDSFEEEYGKFMTVSMLMGDAEFALGALIDVILSYWWLFDHTADWDNTLQVFAIFAAVMWLHCSLVYMGVFVYDYHKT